MADVFISYRRVKPDQDLAAELENHFIRANVSHFIDTGLRIGQNWDETIDGELRACRSLVVLLSAESIRSDTVKYEVRLAHELKKRILPIRVDYEGTLPYSSGALLDPIQYMLWRRGESFAPICDAIVDAIGERSQHARTDQDAEESSQALPGLGDVTKLGGAPLVSADSGVEFKGSPALLPMSPFPDRRSSARRKVKMAGLCLVALLPFLALWVFSSFSGGRSLTGTHHAYSRYERNNKSQRVLVFLHGLGETPEQTWTCSRTHKGWPALIKDDPAFADTDIYVVGYDVPPLEDSSEIQEVARVVGEKFKDDYVFDHHEIVFVAHGTGGLIAQEYLLNHPANVPKVLFIFSLSAPFTASALGSGDRDTYLAFLDRRWKKSLDASVKHFCALEISSTAPSGCSAGHTIQINEDHTAIAQPCSNEDQVYRALRNRMAAVSSSRLAGPSPLCKKLAHAIDVAVRQRNNAQFKEGVQALELRLEDLANESPKAEEVRHNWIKSKLANAQSLAPDEQLDKLLQAIKEIDPQCSTPR